jgi:hypothetical protein
VAIQRGRTQHRIDRRHDPVQHIVGRQRRIDQQRVMDRARIGQSRRLDHDPVKGQVAADPPPQQGNQRPGQIAPDRAADAARGHQDDILRRRLDQVMVQPRLAEFVDHHRDPARGRVMQQTVQQRGFARAEKAGEQRDGNGIVHDGVPA